MLVCITLPVRRLECLGSEEWNSQGQTLDLGLASTVLAFGGAFVGVLGMEAAGQGVDRGVVG